MTTQELSTMRLNNVFCKPVLGGHREITNSEFRRQVNTRKSDPGELEVNLSHNDVKCENIDHEI